MAPPYRVGIVVARFNESVTSRLLTGAEGCLEERGVAKERRDVRWVAGAWEIPVVARAMATAGGYDAIIALGAVIRGETPHFDFIAGETARGLMDIQTAYGVPVGFGVLTCDNMEQALARAGGAAGNKGFDAAEAALGAVAAARADGRS
ncbi:MAG TPA: 6,7-dimethyl-8-ribityllumazine synthase [Gemmatimonadales bacterium]